MPASVEALGVSRRFGSVVAVDNVTLKARGGELVAILGPNGAGKSTLLSIMSGALEPDEGEVLVNGLSIHKHPEARATVGFVPQEYGFLEELTVMENLVYAASLYGMGFMEARAKARELLEELGLKDFEKRKAKQLSGGLKRRLSIAMGLIHEPSVLLLDEPTTGLDPRARRDLIRELEGYARRGAVVIFSTHIASDAEHASRVVFMHRGRIYADGSPSEVKRRALGGEVKVVELRPGNLEQAVEILEAAGFKVAAKGDFVAVRSQEAEELLPDLIRLLESRGVRVLEARVREASLEDAFVALVGELLRGGEGE